MEIKYMSVKDIKPYEKNAKKHDKTQIANVAESIKQFGFKQPIVVDKNGVCIIGHCRIEAAKKLKMKEVPVVLADDLDEEQARKLRLLDNKTNESDWDFDFLKDDLKDLNFDGFDVDWEIFSPDDYGEESSLPVGEKNEICQMTFTLHEKQKELIEYAIQQVEGTERETFGNTNANGNRLYEVVRQWAERKK